MNSNLYFTDDEQLEELEQRVSAADGDVATE